MMQIQTPEAANPPTIRGRDEIKNPPEMSSGGYLLSKKPCAVMEFSAPLLRRVLIAAVVKPSVFCWLVWVKCALPVFAYSMMHTACIIGYRNIIALHFFPCIRLHICSLSPRSGCVIFYHLIFVRSVTISPASVMISTGLSQSQALDSSFSAGL